ncbi:ATP-binding protein [Campylobacter devanensis]|uniref:ATP-binding protein n=1 Tax=Campylobacter devanensis TaxID=3161138 RepID=UPI0015D7F627|nr:ATP-binding protein [Campylobacter sp. P031]
MNDVVLTKENSMLEKAFENADIALSKSYLSNLTNGEVLSIKTNSNDVNSVVRFFSIGQIITNKSENMRDKLSNVFHSVWNANGSILLLIKGKKDSTEIYMGIKNVLFDDSDDGINHTTLLSEILENNLKANFPGTKSELIRKPKVEELLRDISNSSTVASVSDIAALQSEEENKDRVFIQGIEKLIDAMNGDEYTMLLIADPVSQNDLKMAKLALESQYSQLVPFSEVQITLGENASVAAGETLTKSYTKTLSEGVTNTITHTSGTSKNISRSGTAIGASMGAGAGAVIGSAVPVVGTILGGAVGGAIGGVLGTLTYGDRSEGTNESDSIAKATTTTTSTTEGNSESKSKTITLGKSKGVQIKTENHSIKRMLEKIDETLKRLDECSDIGMWNCAMYCISDSEYVSRLAASTYQSLIRGKNSSLENGAINIWRDDGKDKIMPYLTHMCHPKIRVNELEVTPGTLVSSLELAIHAGLPNKSIAGIPVIECAEFGRAVSSYDTQNSGSKIELGKIFHMHSEEELLVNLSAKSLCSHTFITGSTGSGKSNTVYKILENLPSDVKFLVVEPAKGEYKNVFGSKAKVYGTNPSLTELLKINPFSFPKEIHVLEHIDRLIEIFNVCWPMYAAMPAVLKDAVEKSYEDAGWDLTNNTNAYGENLYPEFSDVARNIKSIIDSSEYNAENKGAYKGSLLTRLKSLTNGLNGLIFNRDEISSEELFDKNVIVDLSRVGSAETKSLIMGILVLKLQEYRMSNTNGMNSDLKHITVLEEAHNLLKRTSTEQSSESANLIGKSVEMLTNAIAEMRTYGEGFIIADQAPALLDMAVIRNTNTKIIMRLPDQDDRELVGKAANLNDDQITELAKLPCGVAAVYQNEWIEPVLCKIGVAESKSGTYECDRTTKTKDESDTGGIKIKIADLLCKGIKASKEELVKDLDKLELKSSIRVEILKYLQNPPKEASVLRLAPIMSELFPVAKRAFMESYKAFVSDTKQWSIATDNALAIEIDELRRKIRQCIITDYICNDVGEVSQLEKWSFDGGRI